MSIINYNGKEFKSTKEMCESFGVPYKVAMFRAIDLWWDIEKALTTPVKQKAVPAQVK